MKPDNQTLASPPSPQRGALHNVKVLDLTTVVLGPIATRILGDHGADVIKVENLEGDPMRANGVSRTPGMSSIFLANNRNKRSIAIDLKKPQGREIFMALAAQADVVIHNMRVPAVSRLGLNYEAVRAVNPDVVYCAATGFGQDGPYRDKPAFDDTIQAASGIASLQRSEQGDPSYLPSLVADKTTGMAVANAVLAALFHHARTGEGQYIEVPMLETMVEFQMAEHMGGLAFDPPLKPAGYGRIMDGGRRPMRSSDGHVAILPYSPMHWKRLFERIERRDLVLAYDFSDRHKLNQIVRQLYAELAAITPGRSSAEWGLICEELDIPFTPVYNMDELPNHPHLTAVGLFEKAVHPSVGPILCVRPAARLAGTPSSIHLHAPTLGEHTRKILGELGYDAPHIDALTQAGVVAAARIPLDY